MIDITRYILEVTGGQDSRFEVTEDNRPLIHRLLMNEGMEKQSIRDLSDEVLAGLTERVIDAYFAHHPPEKSRFVCQDDKYFLDPEKDTDIRLFCDESRILETCEVRVVDTAEAIANQLVLLYSLGNDEMTARHELAKSLREFLKFLEYSLEHSCHQDAIDRAINELVSIIKEKA